MLVYGDAAKTIDPRDALSAARQQLAELDALPYGLARHEAIASLFIDLSELAQGLADAGFEARGYDGISEIDATTTHLLMLIAAALAASWQSKFAEQDVCRSDLEAAVQQLEAFGLPPAIRCNRAEGYAFYALYPESFLEAAASLASRNPAAMPLRVIGLRSIGLGLAALVASATGALAPLSVRPVGHPFQRTLRLSPDLKDSLSDKTQHYAIADEGPGLSGSSFGAVLDCLEAKGIGRDHLHVFPSHAGDLGPMAAEPQRQRWRELDRHIISFEELLLNNRAPEHRLETWFTDLVGSPVEPLRDLAGGRWRELHFTSEAQWPPVNEQQEKRKYLLQTQSGRWLLKFAGLGRSGRSKLPIARALSEAGWTAPVQSLRYGFTLEPWLDQLPLAICPVPRDKLISHLARYIGFRAKVFPAPDESGASIVALGAMLEQNATEALGDYLRSDLQRFCVAAAPLQQHIRRVHTDNRLHPWEWLVSGDEQLIKTDALDHAQAHDLVGCQDISWDIAGAIHEFSLSEGESEVLVQEVVETSGHPVDKELLRFNLCCYPAFQLGLASMGRSSACNPAETARLKDAVDAHCTALKCTLQLML